MATLGDTLLIHLGIDVEGLKTGLKSAVADSQNAAKDIGQEQEKHVENSKRNIAELSRTANGALSNVLGLVKRLAAPVTAALSFGAAIKSYWGGMGQVAQMTGAYYKKLDEWREKMATLRRYTKEDLELYRRTNRAMTDFRIAMADISAEIMRSFSPLFKVALDALEAFTSFISQHKDDVVRFLQVIGTIITTALIPAFIKLSAAMLACPLTWIIGAVGLLALAIDDLLVYLQGGDSTFGAFWGPCVEFAKEAWEWIQQIYDAVTHSEAFEHLKSAVQDTFGLAGDMIGATVDAVKFLWDGIKNLFAEIEGNGTFTALGEMAVAAIDVIVNAVNMLVAVWNMCMGLIIGVATGNWSTLEKGWGKLCDGWKKLWTGVVDFLSGGVKAIVGLVKGVGSALMSLGHKIAEALNLSGIIASAKAKIAELIDFLPDFLKTDSMKQWIADVKKGDSKENSLPEPKTQAEVLELPPTEGYEPPQRALPASNTPTVQAHESLPPVFDVDDFIAKMHAQTPTAADLVKAQNNNSVTNNNSTRNSTQTINNVTINNADAEITQQTLETLNDLETNSSSVANSMMATS